MIILLSISMFLCVCDCAVVNKNLYKLDIIHYNDFHARFEETSLTNSICRTNDDKCIGGFPRLVFILKQLLREKPDAVLLNAGDNFQGTYWFIALRGSITAHFLNMLPHDAHAIGNHEFDVGAAKLGEFLSQLNAPVLIANIDTTREPALQGKYRPSIVVERKGRKIGIIGLLTEDLATFLNIGNVVITSASEAVRKESLALREKGVDIVIVLSHCGLEVDKQLAKDHEGYIDVIVGGHSHSLLWNGQSPSGEPVAAPYPTIMEGNDSKVLIVQASSFSKYVGNLTVYFDVQGKYVKHEGDAIFLNRSIFEDASVKAELQPYALQVHRAEQEVVGETLKAMNAADCWLGECTLGDLTADAMVEYAKEHINSGTEYIAVNQRGNIIVNIEKGKITKGDIFELLPFSDRIRHYQIKGKQIREALEISVSGATSQPFSAQLLLQFSGFCI